MILKKIKKDITHLNEQIAHLLQENANQWVINQCLIEDVRNLKDSVDFLKGESLSVGEDVFVYVKPSYLNNDFQIYKALLVEKYCDDSDSLIRYTLFSYKLKRKLICVEKSVDKQVLTKKQVENKFNIKIEDGVDYWEIKE